MFMAGGAYRRGAPPVPFFVSPRSLPQGIPDDPVPRRQLLADVPYPRELVGTCVGGVGWVETFRLPVLAAARVWRGWCRVPGAVVCEASAGSPSGGSSGETVGVGVACAPGGVSGVVDAG
jgi:hypothetical protein